MPGRTAWRSLLPVCRAIARLHQITFYFPFMHRINGIFYIQCVKILPYPLYICTSIMKETSVNWNSTEHSTMCGNSNSHRLLKYSKLRSNQSLWWEQTPDRSDIKTLILAVWSGSGLPTPSTGVHSHVFIHLPWRDWGVWMLHSLFAVDCLDTIRTGCGKIVLIKSKSLDASNPAKTSPCTSVFMPLYFYDFTLKTIWTK